MGITRTFHPVGQGAFYSEKFETWNGDTFTIVYDCGSTTLSKKVMESKIKKAFPKGSRIDILFISHFHADHINGIELLKNHYEIKTVILPLLSYEAKILLKVAYYLDQKEESSSRLPYDQFEKLIDDPASFFGENETKVITIAPVEGEPHIQEGLPEAIDISQPTGGKTFPSGTPLYPFQDINWFFIPFNYKQDKRGNLFMSAIKEKGLSKEDIDTIEKIVTQKQVIKKAYDSIEGDLPRNSMILFSGGVDERICYEHVKQHSATAHCYPWIYRYSWIHGIYLKKGCHPRHEWEYHTSIQNGCLYLGDIDLNEGDLIEDIRLRLHLFLPNLGTIQVPHHGSKHNFNRSICDLGNIHLAILSFGMKNRYGHPADSVVVEILKDCIFPCLVTEVSSSIVVQHIE